jgi:cbb3-type cytochrome oxidase maturation protein
VSAIFALIIISLLVAVGFLVAFIWAIKSGQFDDNFTPSIRMLWDDKEKMSPSSTDQVEEEK